jgi:hypothetical protein
VQKLREVAIDGRDHVVKLRMKARPGRRTYDPFSIPSLTLLCRDIFC